MENQLLKITITKYTTESGAVFNEIPLSYQLFGKPIGSAPVVLVNHALTGNSNVAGKDGWWDEIIGDNKVINTEKYTVLCFNIPGNGYDEFLIDDYKSFVAKDIANIFLKGLDLLNIKALFALIGGSLGGGIAWEMVTIAPKITKHLIPIATDWKSTDWLIANCQVQELFLTESENPVNNARMHAMLCYRTPESFKERFSRSKNEELQIFNVESWLIHHGKKLQEHYQLASYKLMNQLLKTIDVTKGRENLNVLETVEADIHIIGVDSDLFFTAEENRETHRELASTHANVTYNEIQSIHGHDAFLIEFDQLEKMIAPIFNKNLKNKRLKVLKFGGKSLANEGVQNVISIIEQKVKNDEPIAVVVSARGKSTDQLEYILEKAAKNEDFKGEFEAFKTYQNLIASDVDFSKEFKHLENLFEGVKLLGDYSLKIKDEVLAHGELFSIKILAHLLNKKGIKAQPTDTRALLKTDDNFGNAQLINAVSKENITKYFKRYNGNTVNIVSGFIASNLKNETTTLGRNGSNYTAALLANFLNAEELQNFTHVDGIYTANPDLVSDAKKIEQLSYSEANELANFGANILHAKTIVPLVEKNIDLRILNTFKPNDSGTLVTAKSKSKGITSLSVLNDVALINFEGRGLLGKVGVDARVFKALSSYNISVSIISQGSSERGLGFIVNVSESEKAVRALEREFENDIYTRDVNTISVLNDVAVISIIGQDLSQFHHPYNALIKNQITPLLFNNTITGKNVSLVVKKSQLNKAVNVIHGQVFGVAKKINIAVFGKGLVGGTLINQILENTPTILERRKIQLNVFAISNSKKVLLSANGANSDWEDELDNSVLDNNINTIIDFAEQHHLENLIAVDNTSSEDFVKKYIPLVEAGFDLVSSNKLGNTTSYSFYKELRKALEKNNKTYLYETNVGAGLPLIDTIKLLHDSGENITRIRGVFSGTLSYIFNRFSSENISFSSVLQEAITKGYTEPEPREDLSGNDVARKLLILARELDLENEFEDITIENLIPIKELQDLPRDTFLDRLDQLNAYFKQKKDDQEPNHVLRYIGDLHGDLSQTKGELDVKLVSVPLNSPLGNLKGSDAIFEIYTESYGEQPLVIQGAGAGAQVTARGVFGDILRLAQHNN